MNVPCAYQWAPIRIKVSDSYFRNKLAARHDEEIEVKEEFELLVQDLR